MAVFVRLLETYRRHGFRIRAGLNPLYFGNPDAPFTRLFDERGEAVSVGAGMAPQELHFLECLFEGGYRPKRVLVVGNAFGWSSLALGLLLPDSLVVAIDAGLEGAHTSLGADLTRKIAAEERINVKVVDALSPRDLPRVASADFGGQPIDFVLIDGLHTNEQLVRDFRGIVAHASPDCVFVFHDVLSWHMLSAFNTLEIGGQYERRLLTRCPSGVGILFPQALDASARRAVDAFCDDTLELPSFHERIGATADRPGAWLGPRLSPGWKRRRLAMAHAYSFEGDTVSADAQLRAAAAEHPTDAEIQCEIGLRYLDRTDWITAEGYLRNACRLAPQWALPAHQLGRALHARGQAAEAAELLQRAASLEPDWAPPHLELGVLLFKEGRDEEAIASLSRAVKLDPRQASAQHVMGLCMARRYAPDAGIPWFEQAIALDPTCAEAHFDLGIARAALGEHAAAATQFERAGDLRPTWAAPWFEAAKCWLEVRRWDDASARLEHAATLGLSDPELWERTAFVHKTAGRWALALNAFRHARGRDGRASSIDKEIGVCLRELGRPVEAQAVLMEAIAANPHWAGAYFELGRTCEAMDDQDAARTHYERAAILRPAWADARAACERLAVTASS